MPKDKGTGFLWNPLGCALKTDQNLPASLLLLSSFSPPCLSFPQLLISVLLSIASNSKYTALLFTASHPHRIPCLISPCFLTKHPTLLVSFVSFLALPLHVLDHNPVPWLKLAISPVLRITNVWLHGAQLYIGSVVERYQESCAGAGQWLRKPLIPASH